MRVQFGKTGESKWRYIMVSYERPYTISEIVKFYGLDKSIEILGRGDDNDSVGQKCHRWRAETGIELIHPEPDLDEQIRVWNNWNKMTNSMKTLSDIKCRALYNRDNRSNYKYIMRSKWGGIDINNFKDRLRKCFSK